jgi:DNA-binding transcriptional LysR family regulator
MLERPLFQRSNRRVELTAAGARLVAHARRIEGEFAEAERTVRDDPAARLVRIGIVSTLPAGWVEQALVAVRGTGERLELVEGRMRDLSPKLDRGRIDAVLGPLPAGIPGDALFTEGYAMTMAADHPLAARDTVSADEVAAEVMIVRRHCEALTAVSRFFTARGVRPFMAARTTNDERAVGYVRAGLGITVMPRCFAQAGIAMPALAGFDATRTIGFRSAPGGEGRLAASAAFARFRAAIVALHGGAA